MAGPNGQPVREATAARSVAESGVTTTLVVCGQVAFRVLDDATGSPIANVRLRITLPDGTEIDCLTAADGRIEINDVGYGECAVTSPFENLRIEWTLTFERSESEPTEESDTGEPGECCPPDAVASGPPTCAEPTREVQGPEYKIADVLEYKVKTGDTLDSLARAHSLTWQELAVFNWGTSVPEEINEHLRDEVGCTKKAADGVNYRFDDSDDPGLIYIPRRWQMEDLETDAEHELRVSFLPNPKLREDVIDEILTSLNVVRRNSWGRLTPNYAKLESDWYYGTVVVHHWGDNIDPRDNWKYRNLTDAQLVEAKHMEKRGFDDVGYHFLVDLQGTIYEGRNLRYLGAHTISDASENLNHGKIGICALGDFEYQWWDKDQAVTQALLSSLELLISTLARKFPTLQYMGGHRDFKSTECPGTALYKHIDDIRNAVGLGPPVSEQPGAAPRDWDWYTIKEDDWLSTIAPRYGMTWQELYAYDPTGQEPNSSRLRSGDPNVIYRDETIRVPKP